MAMAVGNMGGAVRTALRSRGRRKPTAKPYFQPQRRPHSSTGRCMGQSMFPIWGICPVKKGRM